MTERLRAFYDDAWRETAVDEAAVLERRRREALHRAFALLGTLRGLLLLEVGSGRGDAAARFVASGARVVVVDLSAAALRRTIAAAPAVRAVQADLERLPFRPGSFDRLFVNSVLMFTDPALSVGEIGGVLRDGGTAVVLEPLSGNPLMAAYRAASGRYRGLARWHTLSRLRTAFVAAFADVRIEPFYILPAACLLDGVARRAARALDAFLLSLAPALDRRAWLAVARLSGPRRAEP